MKRATLLVVAIIALAALVPARAHGQHTLEVEGLLGYTQVDAEAFANRGLYDWNHLAYGLAAQFLRGTEEQRRVRLGAELAYQSVFWYEYQQTLFGTTSYGDYTATALRLMGKARAPIGSGRAFTEAGAGFYFFDGFTDLAISGAIGTYLDVGDRFTVPLKLRADLIFDSDSNMVPFTLSAGLAFRVGGES